MRRKILALVIGASAILLGLPATAFAAQAHGITLSPVARVGSAGAPMAELCQLSPNVKVPAGADLASLCAQESVKARGAVSPQDIAEGACGDSYVWFFDVGSGYAGFDIGVDSKLGSIVVGEAVLSWVNHTNGRSGARDYPITANVSPLSWADTVDFVTADGTVSGTLSGDVLLSDNVVCYILNPYDEGKVT